MTSVIKVDQIQTANGATPTAGSLGLNVQGSVLQVVQSIKTDTQAYATTAWTDISGLSVEITPKALGSSFYVAAFVTVGTEYFQHNIRLVRDGSVVTEALGASPGSRIAAWATVNSFDSGFTNSYTPYFNAAMSPNYLDSPTYGSLSPITYKVQGWGWLNGVINRSYDDTDFNSRARATSTLTVMEIAG